MTASLALSPLTNLRDLGGIAVEGGTVRSGRLWRADDVARVDEATAEQLVAQGLELILDLRSGEELAHTGRGPLGQAAVRHLHLPMSDRASAPGQDLAATLREYFGEDASAGMGTWYAMTAVAQAPKVLAGFEAIVQTPGASVFHCTAGKDRTGVFAAAVLLTLGASQADVVADYVRTNDNLDALLNRIAEGGGGTAAITSESVPMAVRGAPASNMLTMLDQLDTNHGGMVQVLRDAGMGTDLEAALRDHLVSPA